MTHLLLTEVYHTVIGPSLFPPKSRGSSTISSGSSLGSKKSQLFLGQTSALAFWSTTPPPLEKLAQPNVQAYSVQLQCSDTIFLRKRKYTEQPPTYLPLMPYLRVMLLPPYDFKFCSEKMEYGVQEEFPAPYHSSMQENNHKTFFFDNSSTSLYAFLPPQEKI